MTGKLQGKIALITGGASGIGEACAEVFAREGATVVVTDLQVDKGQAVATRVGGTFVSHDVSDEQLWIAAVDGAVAAHGRLDVVVNNAGMFAAQTIEDSDLALWNKVLSVNLTGVMLGCKHAIRAMKANPGGPTGSIVNVSSITGYIGLASAAAYTASKGGVRLLTKSVAVHCARQYKTIRCNSLHPGTIDTPMNQAAFDASGDPAAMRAFFDTIQPIGRMATATEMAECAAFLASDASSFVTGSELLADGGWLAAGGPSESAPMSQTNRQWLINGRPSGRGLLDDDFKWVETPMRDPGEGEVTLKLSHISFDPAQKGWMENVGGYVAPTEIGEVMRGSGVGEVVASNDPRFVVGDHATGMVGWQDFATVPAKELTKVEADDLLTANLGVLGTTGMTAFFGLNKIGKPFPGDTLVITGAAGATGSVVGQIGKIAGCRVVGVAGGEAKCKWLVDELGFDAAIDYKAGDIRDQMATHVPDGIDVLWDNVGGKLFNGLLANLAMHARVVVCGGISRYELGKMPAGPENYFNLIFKRATMEGFIVLDWMGEYPWARQRIKTWIREGRMQYKEDVQHGLENAPRTLMRLFQGENFGKQLLKL